MDNEHTRNLEIKIIRRLQEKITLTMDKRDECTRSTIEKLQKSLKKAEEHNNTLEENIKMKSEQDISNNNIESLNADKEKLKDLIDLKSKELINTKDINKKLQSEIEHLTSEMKLKKTQNLDLNKQLGNLAYKNVKLIKKLAAFEKMLI